MGDIKTYRLVKALDSELEPFVGEKFILVKQHGKMYKLGGMGKAFGHVIITTKDVFEKEFEEVDIEKEIDSMIDNVLEKFIGIDFSSDKEASKDEIKKEVNEKPKKEEKTQLDRIEEKVDRLLKFWNLD